MAPIARLGNLAVDSSNAADNGGDPLHGLRLLVKSLEWEITAANLTQLQREIDSLGRLWQGDPVLVGFLRIQRALAIYISSAGRKAHPAGVKLFFAVYRSLEKIHSRPDMAVKQKKRGLLLAHQKYNQLRRWLEKHHQQGKTRPQTEAGATSSWQRDRDKVAAQDHPRPGEEGPSQRAMAAQGGNEEPDVIPALMHLDHDSENGGWTSYRPIPELEDRLESFFDQDQEAIGEPDSVVPLANQSDEQGAFADNEQGAAAAPAGAPAKVIENLMTPPPEAAAEQQSARQQLQIFQPQTGDGEESEPGEIADIGKTGQGAAFTAAVNDRLNELFADTDPEPGAAVSAETPGVVPLFQEEHPDAAPSPGRHEGVDDDLTPEIMALAQGSGALTANRLRSRLDQLFLRYADNCGVAAHLAMLRGLTFKLPAVGEPLDAEQHALMVDLAIAVDSLIGSGEKADGEKACALMLRFFAVQDS